MQNLVQNSKGNFPQNKEEKTQTQTHTTTKSLSEVG
jgi:hypothetical protein